MNSMNDTGVVPGPASGQTSHTHRLRGLAGTGFIATWTPPPAGCPTTSSGTPAPRRSATSTTSSPTPPRLCEMSRSCFTGRVSRPGRSTSADATSVTARARTSGCRSNSEWAETGVQPLDLQHRGRVLRLTGHCGGGQAQVRQRLGVTGLPPPPPVSKTTTSSSGAVRARTECVLSCASYRRLSARSRPPDLADDGGHPVVPNERTRSPSPEWLAR
jgi:hypothetical protein